MAKPWERQVVNEEPKPQEEGVGYLEGFVGANASDTLSLIYASKQRDIFDKISNHEYKDDNELNSLKEQFINYVNLEDQERLKQENYKNQLRKKGDFGKALSYGTSLGGSIRGAAIQAKDTALGYGADILRSGVNDLKTQIPIWYNVGKNYATGSGRSGTLGGLGAVATLMASRAGLGTRGGNVVGAVEGADDESKMEAWDAFREVMERGGTIEQAEQARDNVYMKNLAITGPGSMVSAYIGNRMISGAKGLANSSAAGKLLGEKGTQNVNRFSNLFNKLGKYDPIESASTKVAKLTGNAAAGTATGVLLTGAMNTGEEEVQEHSQDLIRKNEVERVFGNTGEDTEYTLGNLLKTANTKEGWETTYSTLGTTALMNLLGLPFSARGYVRGGYGNQRANTLGQNVVDQIEKNNINPNDDSTFDKSHYNTMKQMAGRYQGKMADEIESMDFQDVATGYVEGRARELRSTSPGLTNQEAIEIASNEFIGGISKKKSNYNGPRELSEEYKKFAQNTNTQNNYRGILVDPTERQQQESNLSKQTTQPTPQQQNATQKPAFVGKFKQGTFDSRTADQVKQENGGKLPNPSVKTNQQTQQQAQPTANTGLEVSNQQDPISVQVQELLNGGDWQVTNNQIPTGIGQNYRYNTVEITNQKTGQKVIVEKTDNDTFNVEDGSGLTSPMSSVDFKNTFAKQNTNNINETNNGVNASSYQGLGNISDQNKMADEIYNNMDIEENRLNSSGDFWKWIHSGDNLARSGLTERDVNEIAIMLGRADLSNTSIYFNLKENPVDNGTWGLHFDKESIEKGQDQAFRKLKDKMKTEAVIMLWKGADATTVLHELGHNGFESLDTSRKMDYIYASFQDAKSFTLKLMGLDPNTTDEQFLNMIRQMEETGTFPEQIKAYGPVLRNYKLYRFQAIDNILNKKYGGLNIEENFNVLTQGMNQEQVEEVMVDSLRQQDVWKQLYQRDENGQFKLDPTGQKIPLGQASIIAAKERYANEFTMWYFGGYLAKKRPENWFQYVADSFCRQIRDVLHALDYTANYVNTPQWKELKRTMPDLVSQYTLYERMDLGGRYLPEENRIPAFLQPRVKPQQQQKQQQTTNQGEQTSEQQEERPEIDEETAWKNKHEEEVSKLTEEQRKEYDQGVEEINKRVYKNGKTPTEKQKKRLYTSLLDKIKKKKPKEQPKQTTTPPTTPAKQQTTQPTPQPQQTQQQAQTQRADISDEEFNSWAQALTKELEGLTEEQKKDFSEQVSQIQQRVEKEVGQWTMKRYVTEVTSIFQSIKNKKQEQPQQKQEKTQNEEAKEETTTEEPKKEEPTTPQVEQKQPETAEQSKEEPTPVEKKEEQPQEKQEEVQEEEQEEEPEVKKEPPKPKTRISKDAKIPPGIRTHMDKLAGYKDNKVRRSQISNKKNNWLTDDNKRRAIDVLVRQEPEKYYEMLPDSLLDEYKNLVPESVYKSIVNKRKQNSGETFRKNNIRRAIMNRLYKENKENSWDRYNKDSAFKEKVDKMVDEEYNKQVNEAQTKKNQPQQKAQPKPVENKPTNTETKTPETKDYVTQVREELLNAIKDDPDYKDVKEMLQLLPEEDRENFIKDWVMREISSGYKLKSEVVKEQPKPTPQPSPTPQPVKQPPKKTTPQQPKQPKKGKMTAEEREAQQLQEQQELNEFLASSSIENEYVSNFVEEAQKSQEDFGWVDDIAKEQQENVEEETSYINSSSVMFSSSGGQIKVFSPEEMQKNANEMLKQLKTLFDFSKKTEFDETFKNATLTYLNGSLQLGEISKEQYDKIYEAIQIYIKNKTQQPQQNQQTNKEQNKENAKENKEEKQQLTQKEAKELIEKAKKTNDNAHQLLIKYVQKKINSFQRELIATKEAKEAFEILKKRAKGKEFANLDDFRDATNHIEEYKFCYNFAKKYYLTSKNEEIVKGFQIYDDNIIFDKEKVKKIILHKDGLMGAIILQNGNIASFFYTPKDSLLNNSDQLPIYSLESLMILAISNGGLKTECTTVALKNLLTKCDFQLVCVGDIQNNKKIFEFAKQPGRVSDAVERIIKKVTTPTNILVSEDKYGIPAFPTALDAQLFRDAWMIDETFNSLTYRRAQQRIVEQGKKIEKELKDIKDPKDKRDYLQKQWEIFHRQAVEIAQNRGFALYRTLERNEDKVYGPTKKGQINRDQRWTIINQRAKEYGFKNGVEFWKEYQQRLQDIASLQQQIKDARANNQPVKDLQIRLWARTEYWNHEEAYKIRTQNGDYKKLNDWKKNWNKDKTKWINPKSLEYFEQQLGENTQNPNSGMRFFYYATMDLKTRYALEELKKNAGLESRTKYGYTYASISYSNSGLRKSDFPIMIQKLKDAGLTHITRFGQNVPIEKVSRQQLIDAVRKDAISIMQSKEFTNEFGYYSSNEIMDFFKTSGEEHRFNLLENSKKGFFPRVIDKVNDILRRKYGGLFIGVDGQVRLFVSDENSKINNGFLPDNKFFKDGAEAQKFFEDIIKSRGGVIYLRDILKHDELYELYSGLENVRIFLLDKDYNALGIAQPTEGSNKINPDNTINYYGDIGINPFKINDNFNSANIIKGGIFENKIDFEKSLRSVLIHEIQHLIQGAEGFARGSYNEFNTKRKTIVSQTRYRDYIGEAGLRKFGEDFFGYRIEDGKLTSSPRDKYLFRKTTITSGILEELLTGYQFDISLTENIGDFEKKYNINFQKGHEQLQQIRISKNPNDRVKFFIDLYNHFNNPNNKVYKTELAKILFNGPNNIYGNNRYTGFLKTFFDIAYNSETSQEAKKFREKEGGRIYRESVGEMESRFQERKILGLEDGNELKYGGYTYYAGLDYPIRVSPDGLIVDRQGATFNDIANQKLREEFDKLVNTGISFSSSGITYENIIDNAIDLGELQPDPILKGLRTLEEIDKIREQRRKDYLYKHPENYKRSQNAFTASPSAHDERNFSYIGSGEGSRVWGWGGYLSRNWVAEMGYLERSQRASEARQEENEELYDINFTIPMILDGNVFEIKDTISIGPLRYSPGFIYDKIIEKISQDPNIYNNFGLAFDGLSLLFHEINNQLSYAIMQNRLNGATETSSEYNLKSEVSKKIKKDEEWLEEIKKEEKKFKDEMDQFSEIKYEKNIHLTNEQIKILKYIIKYNLRNADFMAGINMSVNDDVNVVDGLINSLHNNLIDAYENFDSSNYDPTEEMEEVAPIYNELLDSGYPMEMLRYMFVDLENAFSAGQEWIAFDNEKVNPDNLFSIISKSLEGDTKKVFDFANELYLCLEEFDRRKDGYFMPEYNLLTNEEYSDWTKKFNKIFSKQNLEEIEKIINKIDVTNEQIKIKNNDIMDDYYESGTYFMTPIINQMKTIIKNYYTQHKDLINLIDGDTFYVELQKKQKDTVDAIMPIIEKYVELSNKIQNGVIPEDVVEETKLNLLDFNRALPLLSDSNSKINIKKRPEIKERGKERYDGDFNTARISRITSIPSNDVLLQDYFKSEGSFDIGNDNSYYKETETLYEQPIKVQKSLRELLTFIYTGNPLSNKKDFETYYYKLEGNNEERIKEIDGELEVLNDEYINIVRQRRTLHSEIGKAGKDDNITSDYFHKLEKEYEQMTEESKKIKEEINKLEEEREKLIQNNNKNFAKIKISNEEYNKIKENNNKTIENKTMSVDELMKIIQERRKKSGKHRYSQNTLFKLARKYKNNLINKQLSNNDDSFYSFEKDGKIYCMQTEDDFINSPFLSEKWFAKELSGSGMDIYTTIENLIHNKLGTTERAYRLHDENNLIGNINKDDKIIVDGKEVKFANMDHIIIHPLNKSNYTVIESTGEIVAPADESASRLLNRFGIEGLHYFGGRDRECFVLYNDHAYVNEERYKSVIIKGKRKFISDWPSKFKTGFSSLYRNKDDLSGPPSIRIIDKVLEDFSKIQDYDEKDVFNKIEQLYNIKHINNSDFFGSDIQKKIEQEFPKLVDLMGPGAAKEVIARRYGIAVDNSGNVWSGVRTYDNTASMAKDFDTKAIEKFMKGSHEILKDPYGGYIRFYLHGTADLTTDLGLNNDIYYIGATNFNDVVEKKQKSMMYGRLNSRQKFNGNSKVTVSFVQNMLEIFGGNPSKSRKTPKYNNPEQSMYEGVYTSYIKISNPKIIKVLDFQMNGDWSGNQFQETLEVSFEIGKEKFQMNEKDFYDTIFDNTSKFDGIIFTDINDNVLLCLVGKDQNNIKTIDNFGTYDLHQSSVLFSSSGNRNFHGLKYSDYHNFVDRYKDVYQVTFTKSARSFASRRAEIKYLQDRHEEWQEKELNGELTFTRIMPYPEYKRKITYNGINDKDNKEYLVTPKERTRWEQFRDNAVEQYQKGVTNVFNDLNPAYRICKNVGAESAYEKMVVYRNQGNLAYDAISNGFKYYDENGDIQRSASLESIVSTIGTEEVPEIDGTGKETGKMMNQQWRFILYGYAKRTKELAARNIEQPMKVEEADNIINYIESNNTPMKDRNGNDSTVSLVYQQELNNFIEYNNRLLHVLVEGGLHSEEEYQRMLHANAFYIPLQKDFSEEEGDITPIEAFISHSSSYVNLKSPLKLIKGSKDKRIRNPLEVAKEKTIHFFQLKAKNEVALTFIDEIIGQVSYTASNKPVLLNSNLIHRIAPHSFTKKGKPLYRVKDEDQTFYVMRNGQKEVYQIADRELFRTLRNLDAEQLKFLNHKFIKPFTGMASLVRATATSTPDFGVGNLMRDTMTAWMSSENGFIPLLDSIWGMYQYVNDTQWAREYLLNNGEFGTLLAEENAENVLTIKEKQKLGKVLERIIHPTSKMDCMKAVYTLVTDKGILNLLGKIQGFNTMLELGTRIAEYKNARMEYKQDFLGEKRWFNGGFTELMNPDIKKATGDIIHSSKVSKDITVNFGQHGRHWTVRTANRFTPFFNAWLQGIYKQLNVLGYATTYLTGNLRKLAGQDVMLTNGEKTRGRYALLKLGMLAVAGILKAYEGAGDPDYDDAQDWEKEANWVFSNGYKHPKSQEFDRLIGSTFEKITYNHIKGKETSIPDILWDVLGCFKPDSYLPACVQLGLIMTGSGYNTFTRQTIVPDYMRSNSKGEQTVGYKQVDLYTSNMAADLSYFLYNILNVNVSAKKLDAALQQSLSNTNTYLKAFYDAAKYYATGIDTPVMPRGAEPGDFNWKDDLRKNTPKPVNAVLQPFANRFNTRRNTPQSIIDFQEMHKQWSKAASGGNLTKEQERAWKIIKDAYDADKNNRKMKRELRKQFMEGKISEEKLLREKEKIEGRQKKLSEYVKKKIEKIELPFKVDLDV